MKKLKIMFAVPEGEDMGGIISSSENLMAGFKELGHSVTFARVRSIPSLAHTGRPDRENIREEDWSIGEGSGYDFHPVQGWAGPYYSMTNSASVDKFIADAQQHDVVVWIAMYGFANNRTEGTTDWTRMLTGHGVPQVAFNHDDHLWTRQAWSCVFDDYVAGWAGVQHCSFDSLKGMKSPRAMISPGHDMSRLVKNPLPLGKRDRTMLSLQVAKSWKKVDKLVAAVPYIRDAKVLLGGDGIELRYMRSKEKCKPRYLCTPTVDPDATAKMRGKRIWDNATASKNFEYVGTMSEERRDQLMRKTTLLVDLSTRANSGQLNRVVVESMMAGTVVVAVPDFLSGVRRETPFVPGTHYLPIDSGGTPREIAETLNSYMSMSPKEFRRIQSNATELIQQYDRKLGAQHLIDLALRPSKKAGMAYAKGAPNEELLEKGRKDFATMFGEMP
jgi:glycosyltransferase involved in cell wall biosynthesis